MGRERNRLQEHRKAVLVHVAVPLPSIHILKKKIVLITMSDEVTWTPKKCRRVQESLCVPDMDQASVEWKEPFIYFLCFPMSWDIARRERWIEGISSLNKKKTEQIKFFATLVAEDESGTRSAILFWLSNVYIYIYIRGVKSSSMETWVNPSLPRY